MPVLVMAKLCRNFNRDISYLASLFFYFFEAMRPQIRIDIAQAGSSSKVDGLVSVMSSGRQAKERPHADTKRCDHNDKDQKMPHLSFRHRKKMRPGGPRLISDRLCKFGKNASEEALLRGLETLMIENHDRNKEFTLLAASYKL